MDIENRSRASSSSSQPTMNEQQETLGQIDIITKIKNDHRKVEMLFERFKLASGIEAKNQVKCEIIKELCVHAACEEMVFYPAIEKFLANNAELGRLGAGQAMAQHSRNEHADLKKLMYEIEKLDIDDIANLDAKMGVLIRDVTHHVKEEEDVLLPSLGRAVSGAQLLELGDSFLRHASVAPTHPHPSAPDKPPLNIAANLAAKPLDKIRDAL